MIEMKFNPEDMTMQVSGHAGQNVKGRDIVCAAVSVLFQALAEALFENRHLLKGDPVYRAEEGSGFLSCVPKPERIKEVMAMYQVCLCGFSMLERAYGAYLKCDIAGVEKQRNDFVK